MGFDVCCRKAEFFAGSPIVITRVQLLQSCEEFLRWVLLSQGFKANPGLPLSNAFSVRPRNTTPTN
jgi:hypothetical protein